MRCAFAFRRTLNALMVNHMDKSLSGFQPEWATTATIPTLPHGLTCSPHEWEVIPEISTYVFFLVPPKKQTNKKAVIKVEPWNYLPVPGWMEKQAAGEQLAELLLLGDGCRSLGSVGGGRVSLVLFIGLFGFTKNLWFLFCCCFHWLLFSNAKIKTRTAGMCMSERDSLVSDDTSEGTELQPSPCSSWTH